MRYRIHLEDRLEPSWRSWFEGMSVEVRPGGTILLGELPDQPALHGLLKRIRDRGLTIVGIERLEPPPRSETCDPSGGA